MRDSVEAVAKYYVQGGSKDSQAAVIGNAAWTAMPSGGTLTITRTSSCSGVTVTTANCSDGSVPQIKLLVSETSSWSDPTSSSIFPNGLSIVQTI